MSSPTFTRFKVCILPQLTTAIYKWPVINISYLLPYFRGVLSLHMLKNSDGDLLSLATPRFSFSLWNCITQKKYIHGVQTTVLTIQFKPFIKLQSQFLLVFGTWKVFILYPASEIHKHNASDICSVLVELEYIYLHRSITVRVIWTIFSHIPWGHSPKPTKHGFLE